jgi:hypothetical protein
VRLQFSLRVRPSRSYHFFWRDFSEMTDCFPRILPNRLFYSHLGNLASSTRSTVFQLPPQSTINIFFGSSDLFLLSFLSEYYIWLCLSTFISTNLIASDFWDSKISNLNSLFFPIFPMSKSSNSRIFFHLSTLTMDGSDDFITLELCKVHSLGHFQGFRPRAISLGSNDYWFSHSEMMDQI